MLLLLPLLLLLLLLMMLVKYPTGDPIVRLEKKLVVASEDTIVWPLRHNEANRNNPNIEEPKQDQRNLTTC